MDEFVVKIKPVTPIWTGDENRKNTTLRETGILGSLRWWYEALIRGLGGTACDPTKTKCEEKNIVMHVSYLAAQDGQGSSDWKR